MIYSMIIHIKHVSERCCKGSTTVITTITFYNAVMASVHLLLAFFGFRAFLCLFLVISFCFENWSIKLLIIKTKRYMYVVINLVICMIPVWSLKSKPLWGLLYIYYCFYTITFYCVNLQENLPRARLLIDIISDLPKTFLQDDAESSILDTVGLYTTFLMTLITQLRC